MMEKEDSSNGYQNTYDLTRNMGDYGYKEYDNLAYGAGRPEQTNPGPSWLESSDSWESPLYGVREGYLANQGPSRNPSSRPTKNDQNPMQQKLNNIDWKTIVMLVLLKLGLAKLQTAGFLKILFLLGFLIKLYMIAVFFKFLLIIKLMKFFKVLLLPLFLIQLLPTLTQLLLMPGRLLDLLRQLINNNMLASQTGGLLSSQSGGLLPSQSGGLLPSQSGGLLPSQSGGFLIPSQPGGLLPSQSGGLLPSRPSGLLPNRSAASTPSNTQQDGMVRATGEDIFQINGSTMVNYNIDGKTNDPVLKIEDIDLTDIHSDESIQLSDSTFDIFQKILDSEKCMERIPCRFSVAKKTGNVPIWINW